MKAYLRPFLKIDVVAASGATITFLYFSVTLATASLMAEEYGSDRHFEGLVASIVGAFVERFQRTC